jgi:hypothetical protein
MRKTNKQHLTAVHAVASGVLIFGLCQWAGAVAILPADLPLEGSTTDWTPVMYGAVGQPSNPDAFQDPQSDDRTDIIGDPNHPAFYTRYAAGNESTIYDDMVAFRIRLGGSKGQNGNQTPYFDKVLMIYLDANQDGAIDLMLGVDGKAQQDNKKDSDLKKGKIKIWDPGSGTNTSPNTSTIGGTYFEVDADSGNYHFDRVTTGAAGNDPSALSTNIDGDKEDDVFLSFSIPVYVIADTLENHRQIAGFNQDAVIQMVLATSENENVINGDICGPTGLPDNVMDMTWSEMNAISGRQTVGGVYVPEPTTLGLLGLGGLALLCRRRR